MNSILELKGKRFIQESRHGNFGGPAMNSTKTVSAKNIQKLIDDLTRVKKFWNENPHPFKGILLNVHYNKIVAKSNRIAGLLKGKESNHSIVGAKYNNEKTSHIITNNKETIDIDQSHALLAKTQTIIETYFANGITKAQLEDKSVIEKIPYSKFLVF